jgi:hypothetical protein
MPRDASPVVLLWWALISLISVVNIVLWLVLARRYGRSWQVFLSGIYVFVCAFRSFVPRADVQRICFVDSWYASVLVGRSIATVAELCFMTQLVLTGRRLARTVNAPPWLVLLVTLPLPMIVVAETASWYAVLSTNYVGNFIEQSLWMLSGLLLGVCMFLMRPRASGPLRRMLTVLSALGLLFFSFMVLVDVRMYLARLREDALANRTFLALGAGLHDCLSRRVVTFAWRDWHEELAWMFLYFSATVWLSLLLARASHRPLPGQS